MALVVKRSVKHVPVCLDGELVAKHEALEVELTAARQKALVDARLNSGVRSLAEQIAEVEAAAEAETVEFILRALPGHVWESYRDAHPARQDNEADDQFGVNVDTIIPAVLSDAEHPTIVGVVDSKGEPVEFGPAEWPTFSADLSYAQKQKFAVAVLTLNLGSTNVPFSLTAYNVNQRSGRK